MYNSFCYANPRQYQHFFNALDQFCQQKPGQCVTNWGPESCYPQYGQSFQQSGSNGFQNFFGGYSNDSLHQWGQGNTANFYGSSGQDTLTQGGYNNSVDFHGGYGNDTAYLGGNRNTAYLDTGAGQDQVNR
ncbi:MAG: hypothetical protein K2X01_11620 [Cyanobacteria bacterium]|nr:hypothetical protein [Cyanobacteriota bacterium]